MLRDALSVQSREFERTPELELVRARLFPDLSPEEGWKQIEAAIKGSLDPERWRRIEQLAEADLAADLAAQLPNRRIENELANWERVERADRFRLLWWRVETLIAAGYSSEQATQLGRNLEVEVQEAVELLHAGVPPADATARLLQRAD